MPAVIDRDKAENVLRRLFGPGRLRRLPKKADDTQLILALAISDLDPTTLHAEHDINVHLSAWLDGIASRSLDYVTLRRYLVDYGFLIRERSGAWYRLMESRVSETVDVEARTIKVHEIFDDVRRERDARRRAYKSSNQGA